MILRVNDRILTRQIDKFSRFNLKMAFDQIASHFEFQFYFDPDDKDHRDITVPGHYHIVTLEHEGQRLLTGYMLSIIFGSDEKRELTTITGYSKPGFLEDCEIPPEVYPLQSDGLNLREIAEKFVKPFGIDIVIDSIVAAEMEEPYDQATAKDSQSVKAYLSSLASQKNIFLTHDVYGRLVFTRANRGRKPVYNFTNGQIPATKMSLRFDGQQMHSDINVFAQADIIEGTNATKEAVKNPYVPFVYRPHVVTQTSGPERDAAASALNIRAQELKALGLSIELDRISMNGNIFLPGQLVTVENPEVALYKKSLWIIEAVDMVSETTKDTSTLTCCLPEVFTGEEPKYLWSGLNLR